MKKKIIQITNDLYKSGGVQRLIVDLVTMLNNKYDFEIILTRGGNDFEQELGNLGIKVYHIKDLGVLGVLRKLNKAHLVHSHLFPSNYLSLLSKSTLIMTEHNSFYRRRKIPFVKQFESIVFKRYQKVICISEGVKRYFDQSVSWSNNKSMVIYNGVDLNRFRNVSKIRKYREGAFRLGMVGRLVPQKDYKSLIKCLTILKPDVELHIAGTGPLSEELKSYAKTIGVSDRVVFHGQVTDIANFLNSLDLYVQSSNWEGFGLAVVEAMATGLPCLASNVDGLNEILDSTMLFEVGDIKSLSDKVNFYKDNFFEYEKMSKLSIDKAKEFSIEQFVNAHDGIYSKFIYF